MTPAELKQVMQDIGCNSAETAAFLGIARSSFQRYVDGSARIPADLSAKLIEQKERDRKWLPEMMARLNADLASRFPQGFMSAPGCDL